MRPSVPLPLPTLTISGPAAPPTDGPRSRDIEQAHATGDTERAAQADTERGFLMRELNRAFGLSGRGRRAASASERARSGVIRAVRQAMTRIGEHHPPLGEHLSHAIRTGTYCAYLPDPRAPAAWTS